MSLEYLKKAQKRTKKEIMEAAVPKENLDKQDENAEKADEFLFPSDK